MNVGKLAVQTDGPEDLAIVIHVDNNDANLVNQSANLKSLQNPSNINGFDGLGNDVSMTDFIQSYEPVPVEIDGKESSQLVFNYVDSGEVINTYDLKVSFIYAEDIMPTYEEAAAHQDMQVEAVEKVASGFKKLFQK